MTTFRPGNIEIDEQSVSGDVRHPTTPPVWPDPALWKRRMLHWLRLIVRESRVARLVLTDLERPPGSGSRPELHLNRSAGTTETFTLGPIPPNTASNPLTVEAIYVTYSSPDTYGRDPGFRPMEYPPSVLLHELTHALTAIHGLNTPNSWNVPAYPSRGEFWATTMQNMMLSEKGAVLADGYRDGDLTEDPTIGSEARNPVSRGPVGLRADRSRSTTDLARFVRLHWDPLVDFQAAFGNLTLALSRLRMPFNPFRELRRQQAQPGPTRVRGHTTPSPTGGGGGGGVPGTLGGARTPGPIGLD